MINAYNDYNMKYIFKPVNNRIIKNNRKHNKNNFIINNI